MYLNYAGKPVSGGSFTWAKEHLVILGSLSKTYSMTGWRAGFALASKSVTANLSKLQSQSTSNASSIVQKAAVAALNGSQDCVAEFRAEFIQLRDYMLQKLAEIPGITCTRPRRRLLRLPQYFGFPGQVKRARTATELATRLLHEAHVVAVPGEAFGTSEHIRCLLSRHPPKHRRRNPPHGRIPQTTGLSVPACPGRNGTAPISSGGVCLPPDHSLSASGAAALNHA